MRTAENSGEKNYPPLAGTYVRCLCASLVKIGAKGNCQPRPVNDKATQNRRPWWGERPPVL